MLRSSAIEGGLNSPATINTKETHERSARAFLSVMQISRVSPTLEPG
jgi:hypothetical protein